MIYIFISIFHLLHQNLYLTRFCTSESTSTVGSDSIIPTCENVKEVCIRTKNNSECEGKISRL